MSASDHRPMQTTNHPDDEYLARVADADPVAIGDSAMSGHVAGCDRCSALVDDLRSLRLALAAMPDPALQMSRPLRFLPPVDAPRATFADRVGAVIRGAFAPVLTAGAALALIGVVGTTGIGSNFAQSAAGGPDAADETAATEADREGFAADLATPAASAEPAPLDAAAGAESAATEEPATLAEPSLAELLERLQQSERPAHVAPPVEPAGPEEPEAADASAEDQAASRESGADLAAERPIWPMLLFSGVALMIGAVVLRWIFQPRAA